jgi:hypothetical protein
MIIEDERDLGRIESPYESGAAEIRDFVEALKNRYFLFNSTPSVLQ